MQDMSFGGCAPAQMSMQHMGGASLSAPKNAPNEYEFMMS